MRKFGKLWFTTGSLMLASVGAVQSEPNFRGDPAPDMTIRQVMNFEVGLGQMAKTFVPADDNRVALDGLGPLYNEASCLFCHINTGAGRAGWRSGDLPRGMILRLERLNGGGEVRSLRDYDGDPVYGRQLQPRAVPGVLPEVSVKMLSRNVSVYLDGESFDLQKPEFAFLEMNYGDLDDLTFVAPRLATPLWGLGYLTAISEADILSRHDPDDQDGDGISGRAHFALPVDGGDPQIGRFGWVSRIPDISEHSFAALAFDMGVSSPMFPDASGDCTATQVDCLAAPGGDRDRVEVKDLREPEVGTKTEQLFVSYLMGALPPASPPMTEEAERGRALFHDAGCASCHVEIFTTGEVESWPGLSNRVISPYSDLLLHDMGPDLADRDQNGNIANSEFRTSPLWGLSRKANTYGGLYLHDGRARTALEAVLWHGGEAAAARDAVVRMPPVDREALVKFLDSL